MPTIAYVAKDNETIAIVNVDSNVVLSTIPIGFNTNWIALTPDLQKAYLANQFNSTVSVLDLASETIVAVIPLGVSNGKSNQPKQIFILPNGLAYSANISGTVSVIDTATDTLVNTVPIGPNISVMKLSPNGNFFFIGNDSAVSMFSTITNGVINFFPIDGIAGDLAVSPDGNSVYVAIPGNMIINPNNKVAVVDVGLSSQIAMITVGTTPVKVDINSIGSRVYVVNLSSGDLSVIDIPSNTVIATIPIGENPNNQVITPDFGSQDYVANLSPGRIVAVNTTTFTPTNLPLGAVPTSMAITPDGSKLITTTASDFMAIFNTQTNTLITAIDLGAASTFITFVPQSSPSQMPAYSTGVVTNTRDFGTAASNIVLNVSNIDPADTTVLVKIIASVDSDVFYVAYVDGFVVPTGGYEVRTFMIAGNVAYEVQVSTSSESLGPNALVSVYGIDEFGNLVNSQRFAPEELTSIPGVDLGA